MPRRSGEELETAGNEPEGKRDDAIKINIREVIPILVSYVFNSDFGANHEGDLVSLDPDVAKPLVDAGVLTEATEDDHAAPAEPEGDQAMPVAASAKMQASIDRITKTLEESIAKTTAKVLAKATHADVRIPATPKDDGPIFKGVGQLCRAIYKAHGGDVKSRNMINAHRTKVSSGLNETTNADGGFAVVPEWSDTLFQKLHNVERLLDRTTRKVISGDTYNMPGYAESSLQNGQLFGGVSTYWVAEGSAATDSLPHFQNVQCVIQTNVTMIPLSLQLLEDNAYNLEAEIRQTAGTAITYEENHMVISGAGTTQPLGILNQPALVSVAKVGSQTAGTYNYQNALAMWSRLFPESRRNATWIINPQVYAQLLGMVFPTASGTASAFGGLTYDASQDVGQLRIFGRPVVENYNSPALGTVGDVILADLTQLVCVEKAGVRVDVSDQLLFRNLEVLFRFVRRYDIKSSWVTALTPADGGSSTFSPFVVCATRS